MIRAKFLSSMSEQSDTAIELRKRVPEFATGRDEGDEMAFYALAYDEEGQPAGTSRLRIDAQDRFRIDFLGVLPEKRGMYIGDLMARMLLNQKDIARSSEKVVAKAMSDVNYSLLGFRDRNIGGKKAQGYCYNYDKDGIAMYGESFCLKIKKTLYYFHFYCRDSMKEDSIPVWEGMLNEVKWL